ncbi:MAG: hypothetical protein AAB966_04125, partial [Patescibacteria group bacterium]
IPPVQLGRIGFDLIHNLDKILEGVPAFGENAKFKTNSFTGQPMYFGEQYRSSFVRTPLECDVTVKDSLSWEIPVPFLTGIPIPKRTPTLKRKLTVWEAEDDSGIPLFEVLLKSKFKYGSFRDQYEFIKGYVGIKNMAGWRSNTQEAVDRVIKALESIRP